MLSRAMSYVAVVYDLSPAMSALLPGVAFLAVGVVLLRRVQ
jgi:lipopolysaccharide export LptBFGC system permease protein LptF